MPDAPSPNELEPDDSAESDWHAPLLRELAELGMRMARAVTVGAEARAQAGEATAADEAASALALQRAAKMVRLTIALDQRRLEPPAPAIPLERQQQIVDEAEADRAEAQADAAWVMKSLWRLIGQPMVRNTLALAIETEKDAPERERLMAELTEKLEEREDELVGRGPGQYDDIILGLLAELDLTGHALGRYYPQLAAGRVRAARQAATGRFQDSRPAMAAHPPP